MKKSQVLAALALAFALGLGVVAPVANTYATVVFPSNITEEQEEAFNDDKQAALDAYNNLYNVTEYTGLSAEVEEVATALAAADKKAVELYNTGEWSQTPTVATRTNLNTAISDFSKLLNAGANGLYATETVNGKTVYTNLKDGIELTQATFQAMSGLTATVSDVTVAYDNVKNINTIANTNKGILTNNYIAATAGDGSAMDKAGTALETIITLTNDWLYQYGLLYSTTGADTFGAAPSAYVGSTSNLAKIDAEAATDLVNSDAWKKADERAQYVMFVNAAKATPKYNYIGALVAAKTAFNKIDSAESVDYTVAQGYIAALNAAIEAYKNGTPTTPTDPTDPEGPNDTNKPGDADNKDDITNPGNTGVISGTNGTASSTVAVVAGIATALTAAGAGVVAYRNARREA